MAGSRVTVTVIPLYAFVQGDTMGVVVLGRLDGTVSDLGENLLRATGVRVKRHGPFRITSGDRTLDLTAPLATLGIQPLDRVDLVWE
jgi:hypothetical protein